MESKLTERIYLKSFDAEFNVDFIFTPGSPAVYYLSNGDPGYPAEPAEFDILEVYDDTGHPVDYDYDEVYDALTELESEIEESLYEN